MVEVAFPYRYCDYSGCWFRVLRSSNRGRGPYVEVKLTVSSDDPRDWEKEVASVSIQTNGPGRNRHDKLVRELPYRVKKRMVKYLGSPLTKRLLYGDISSPD